MEGTMTQLIIPQYLSGNPESKFIPNPLQTLRKPYHLTRYIKSTGLVIQHKATTLQ